MDYRQKIEQCFIDLKHKNKPFAKRLSYKKVISDSKVIIYRRKPWTGKVIAAFDNAVVVQSTLFKSLLFYYPSIFSSYKKRICFNKKTFPGLIEGSIIDSCMILPYIREIGEGRVTKAIRIVIVTDKCQVYHNNPARREDCDGLSMYNDDIRFEESAIWDLPGRKHPSKDFNCTNVERYFPFLPEEVYEYHPLLNSDERYKDLYGNGGFPKSHIVIHEGKQQEVSRFYFPKREGRCNSFHHIGGEESDYKLTLVGTYRPNNGEKGVRNVVFATDDGGRNWFAKYEFGDFGEYEFSQGIADWRKGWGNTINLSVNDKLPELIVKKRTIIPPSMTDKEPKFPFVWSEPIQIKRIESGECTAIVITKVAHGLKTGNVVAIQSNGDAKGYSALCNNTVTSTHGGNGTLFKVHVINDDTIELFEYVHSSDNPICCRHIHQINRVKDGWLIGTGEIYPNGWLLYFQMKEADTYSVKKAWDEFNIYRLNSTETSVQRTLGAILMDDEKQTIMYASDHDTLDRAKVKVPDGRSMSISRNSTGIFQGPLADIDDRERFKLIYETTEPSFFFKKIDNRLVFGGMRGEFAFSEDRGFKWYTYHIDTEMFYYYGKINNSIIIGDYIITFK